MSEATFVMEGNLLKINIVRVSDDPKTGFHLRDLTGELILGI